MVEESRLNFAGRLFHVPSGWTILGGLVVLNRVLPNLEALGGILFISGETQEIDHGVFRAQCELLLKQTSELLA